MKTIVVKVSDRVLAKLRTHMNLKCILGEACGMPDAFVVKFVKAVDDGEAELTLQLKSEREGGNDSVPDNVPDPS